MRTPADFCLPKFNVVTNFRSRDDFTFLFDFECQFCKKYHDSILNGMEITQLPTELQEAILFHLDGASLARSQCVCRLWQSCVDNLAKARHLWFDKCSEEILAGTLRLLAGCEPRKCVGSWEQWRDVYRRWYQGRCVKTWKMETVWMDRHRTYRRNASDRSAAKQTSLLQFHGDEIVLLEWAQLARWNKVTGDRLATRDMGGMTRTHMVVLNRMITPEADTTGTNSSHMYPCQLIGLGNQLFFFSNGGSRISFSNGRSRIRSFQLPNYINCLDIWSNTLLIGWNTGAVDLYTLPDDLLTCTESELLQTPHRLAPQIFNNWQGGNTNTKYTEPVIVGKMAFLIRAANIEVWDLEKKTFLASELYGSSRVRKMVSNGTMVFCLTGSTLNWFEWSDESQQLLPGQTPESVPSNTTCMSLYGDLLALGTSDGFIYLYHMNKTTIQEENISREESSESSDEDDIPSAGQYSWDPVLSFKRMAVKKKSEIMTLVEGALRNPIHTFCIPHGDVVEAVTISDDGSGPIMAAIGIQADETWVQLVQFFRWSND